MRLHIDRSLPVAISAQLLGQIEYGVSCGSLPPGSRLPSVRELAADLGMSPVTVSQVYRTLQERGLIDTRQGSGTFVSGSDEQPADAAIRLNLIHQQIDSLLRSAERLGIGPEELNQIVQLRLRQPQGQLPEMRLVLVGTFPQPTRAYAADLTAYLGARERIESLTFDDLDRSPEARESLAVAHLAITFPHRLHELAPRLPAGMRVVSLRFIPNERTRTQLAEVAPLAAVTLVSTFPEFLGTLKDSVARFAPHLSKLDATVLGETDMRRKIESCDVVVYSTGAERVMNGLPGHVRALEYRHTPDPISVQAELLPVINELRSAMYREER
jgi:DNA-binding transcriptional regulator YhcF (GntR family)